MDEKIIAEFVELHARKKQLKADLTKTEKAMEPLQKQIMDEFSHAGVNNLSMNGTTVYLHSQLWASLPEGVTHRDAVEALQREGLDEYTMMSTQSLSALMREWDDSGYEIPDGLKGVIEPKFKHSVRARRS